MAKKRRKNASGELSGAMKTLIKMPIL